VVLKEIIVAAVDLVTLLLLHIILMAKLTLHCMHTYRTQVCPKGIKFLKEIRSEEHTSELQSRFDLVCRLLLEKKKINLLIATIIIFIALIRKFMNIAHIKYVKCTYFEL